jgi:geranylgeranyl diphosphate synthase type II
MSYITPVMSDVSYESYFCSTLEHINHALAHYLASVPTIPAGILERLWESLRYATLDGGKRIRPVLAIETCLACGGCLENILPTACAIELVHAQSLVHDDLPCMDNDDLRRGKPTLHKAFDESTAVLAGDALLAMAFGLITRHTPFLEQVTPTALLEIISEFSDVASVHGLVGGQYVDIQFEGKSFTPEILEFIHSYKTGALFTFSIRAGAILSGVQKDVVAGMTEVGQKLGLAFQIVDDLLDIQSTPETLGKTPGKDQIQQKATYPAHYGIQESREKVKVLLAEANAILGSLDLKNVSALKTLADFICNRIH